MKRSFTEKLHLKDCLMLSSPSGFFYSFQKIQREVVGRAGTDEAPPKPCWGYLESPPLIQQQPVSWKRLGAQKRRCASVTARAGQ